MLESKYGGWRGLKSTTINNKDSLGWKDLKRVWSSDVWGVTLKIKLSE